MLKFRDGLLVGFICGTFVLLMVVSGYFFYQDYKRKTTYSQTIDLLTAENAKKLSEIRDQVVDNEQFEKAMESIKIHIDSDYGSKDNDILVQYLTEENRRKFLTLGYSVSDTAGGYSEISWQNGGKQ